MGLKRQAKKRKNRKEEFSKLDKFDLSVIIRIVHGYYARNKNFSLKKLLNKLGDEIHFPYSIITLSLVRFQELSGHYPPSRKQKGKKDMIFNFLKLRWPKKEIAKMKTQTKSRKIKCRKTRPQLQVKGKLTTTAVITIRPKIPR